MAVISQYLGGVIILPLGDIKPYQPNSASYFLQLAVFWYGVGSASAVSPVKLPSLCNYLKK